MPGSEPSGSAESARTRKLLSGVVSTSERTSGPLTRPPDTSFMPTRSTFAASTPVSAWKTCSARRPLQSSTSRSTRSPNVPGSAAIAAALIAPALTPVTI